MKLQPGIKYKVPTGIRWITTTKYIDIDTGEIITTEYNKNKQNFIIIKTDKNVRINQLQTKGIIEYTKQCRRNPQLKAFD